MKHQDKLIDQLISDPNYIIFLSGKVWSKRAKKFIGRFHENSHVRGADKYYHKISYKKKELAVHRIVFRKYIGELNPGLVIDHIDGNSLNNHKNNLRQITQKENMENK